MPHAHRAGAPPPDVHLMGGVDRDVPKGGACGGLLSREKTLKHGSNAKVRDPERRQAVRPRERSPVDNRVIESPSPDTVEAPVVLGVRESYTKRTKKRG